MPNFLGRGFPRVFSQSFRNGLTALSLGALLAGTPAGAASAASMTFRVEALGGGGVCRGACPLAIVAEGQITNSTPGDFLEFLRDNAGNRDLHTVVFLHSEGGYVVASMELGQIFRRIGAATVVARLAPSDGPGGRFLSANCLSACVYAFMGGRKRVAPQGSALGIHRMFANQEQGDWLDSHVVRRYDNGSMAAHLMAYSVRMGVSRDLIRTAEHINSSSLHLVTSSEMARWNLASRVF
ncbi:hypothetical protein CCR94_15970 [Rhodoblastus sphagnicola]|uniref:Periplasmic protein-like protein n=1 Tax=Rhodoblastus sphagnicola TaxID=333368 RepID=A0A2S6N3K7_9HYPH|nr:hypothetical protein [Rhodoblastus sphagnicola]MBB4199155.1 hypothetical protein [Rhodoblastus sphagnicola]PPQ29200.1 hypothetical protein CCR94_15970 [Rhodoblastus sphagnicola]